MAATMQVDIVSAEKEIFSGEAKALFAPAELGEVGILPRHAEMICRLKPGQVRIQMPDSEEEQLIYVSGGILEVQPHVVTILSDTAERAADPDEAAAQEAKQRAEHAQSDQASDFDYAKAQAELAEAVAQLHAIEKLRKLRK
jgi:F-type H+-transporting ATPase subunit epsilon